MHYAVLSVLFVAQAIYMRILFESFRKKVYLDVLDFFIEQGRKEEQNFDSNDFRGQNKKAHLRLIKPELREDHHA